MSRIDFTTAVRAQQYQNTTPDVHFPVTGEQINHQRQHAGSAFPQNSASTGWKENKRRKKQKQVKRKRTSPNSNSGLHFCHFGEHPHISCWHSQIIIDFRQGTSFWEEVQRRRREERQRPGSPAGRSFSVKLHFVCNAFVNAACQHGHFDLTRHYRQKNTKKHQKTIFLEPFNVSPKDNCRLTKVTR